MSRAGFMTGRVIDASLAGLIACVFFVGSGAGMAHALETTSRTGPVELRIRLEPDAPTIGDPMKLVVEAVAEPGVEVLMPDFGDALDRFSIVDFVPRESLDASGQTRSTQLYTLRAPASGPHRIPSILVEFVDRRPGHDPAPEGQDAYEILSDPIRFDVASVVPDAATAELSPPLGRLDPLARDSRESLLWILAIIAALAAGAGPFAWRAWQRMRARAAVRSAYEIARAALDALLAAPHPSPDRIDAYFVDLSGIVRRYLEGRFALRSPELTTERFLDLVSGSPDLTDDHRALLRDFLRECDLVKFAHVIPSEEAIRQALDAALRFIEETREPVGASASADAAREPA
jgi:hypothetical protein